MQEFIIDSREPAQACNQSQGFEGQTGKDEVFLVN